MVHSHTVHLPLGALLSPCTVCGTGTSPLHLPHLPHRSRHHLARRPALPRQRARARRLPVPRLGQRQALHVACRRRRRLVRRRAAHSALPHTVRLPRGALRTRCTVCGTGVTRCSRRRRPSRRRRARSTSRTPSRRRRRRRRRRRALLPRRRTSRRCSTSRATRRFATTRARSRRQARRYHYNYGADTALTYA